MPHAGHAPRAPASWLKPSYPRQILASPQVSFTLVLAMNSLFGALDLGALGLGSQDGLPFCICSMVLLDCVPQSVSN